MFHKHVLTCICLSLCMLTFRAEAQTLIRGPYLQLSTQSSIRIKWRTDIPTDSKVWYGDYHDNLIYDVYDSALTTEHSIEITGLSPGTQYYYAVGSSSQQLAGESDDHYFKTHPPSNSTDLINIWVLGDPGSKDDYQRNTRDAYYNFNGNDFIDMILALGDNAYVDGTDDDFQYGWFEDMYEDRLINSVVFPCYGNHDAGDADSETETGTYFDIFDLPTNGEAGGIPSGTENYYSIDYGNAHIISLNNYDQDRSVNGPMVTWLQQDLAANTKDWLIVFFHYPTYSGYNTNSTDTNTREKETRENILPILEAAGVDLVLYGHSHVYERSFLLNGHYDIAATFNPNTMALDIGDGRVDGDAPYVKAIQGPDDGKGTVYITLGSSGPLSTNHILNHPTTFYSNSAKNGSFAIQIQGLELNAFFIDIDGNIDDHFTIVKQIEPPSVSFTNPLNGTFYENIEQIAIAADAYDSNGSIDKVEFFVNNNLIGVDLAPPYTINWTPNTLGSYRIKCIATDNDGNIKSTVSNIQVGPITICRELLSNSADAEEDQFGGVTLGSSDLELCYDDNFQTVALRYADLRIPNNSLILDAYIQFTAHSPMNLNPCEIKIYAEDSDDSENITSEDYNISTRPKTNAMVTWSPPDWQNYGDEGPDQRTPDLSALIQEVVFRTGYSPNSNFTFLFEGTGRRRAISRTNNTIDQAAYICVEYNPFCPDDDNDGTCNLVDQCPGALEPGTLCDDGDPNTFDDAINENCNCTGQVYDCVDEEVYYGDHCDDNNPETYNDIWNTNCECEGTFATMTYTCGRVAAMEDDAEEDTDGDVKYDSGDLELVKDNDNQTVGMRFTNLNIPFGSIIHHADIQFTADKTDNLNPCFLRIYGEAHPNPVSFTENTYDISSRTKTFAYVDWYPADWRKKGKAEQEERSINIAPVIQEIVNRYGYTENSAIVIIIEGTGKRTAESFDGDEDEAPKLCVDYYYDSPPGGNGGFQAEDDGDKTNKDNHLTATVHTQNALWDILQIYPNPTNKALHINFKSRTSETIPLTIRDVSGHLVFQKDIYAQAGKNHLLIPQLDLSNGVYVLQILLDGQWYTERLVILH